MLPQGFVREAEEEQQPSRTYRMDLQRGRIVGITDGVEAIRQAVYKILLTTRYVREIYSTSYGAVIEIGGGTGLEQAISEALLQDERIAAIENFRTTIDREAVLAEFTVVSIFGRFGVSQEVG
ncbi:DUF2634 domain-containing protein [Xylanibacillus composti]|uniref:DUF2634 domain-containing protein n=1 Tax=Xylanibacillus composti TaxID=1572762 RepID=A0A8J4H8Q5_9BACL|nr:DUF2634 domain-containing protein [Xylanibacillus composti]MDT9723758.1 DUF2634 domain-containing protein [Xylanibacillus composti]GIQ70773.1 hypothetical protein XYCOK13_35970 [Xylanibacillus composti]